MEQKEKERLEILEKIKKYEKEGGESFFKDVENDPPAKVLMPEDVDYFEKKLSTKIKIRMVDKMINKFYKGAIGKYQMEVKGVENLTNIKTGAIVTSNHFGKFESLGVRYAIDSAFKNKKLYKVIREGNYAFTGLLGMIFKYGRTLPLSSNIRTMIKFNKALTWHLKKGNFVLIYPEQAMWQNFKKPRPYKPGAFYFAVKNNVPIIPCFITMSDIEGLDEDGLQNQKYTIHVMPAIYPDKTKTVKQNQQEMMEKNYQLCKAKYEEVYKKKLVYECDKPKTNKLKKTS